MSVPDLRPVPTKSTPVMTKEGSAGVVDDEGIATAVIVGTSIVHIGGYVFDGGGTGSSFTDEAVPLLGRQWWLRAFQSLMMKPPSPYEPSSSSLPLSSCCCLWSQTDSLLVSAAIASAASSSGTIWGTPSQEALPASSLVGRPVQLLVDIGPAAM